MNYVGDFLPGQRVSIPWSTNDQTGASIARSTAGQISCIRASNSAFSTVGVTEAASILGIVGVNGLTIDTSQSFFAAHDDYYVVDNGAVIDGKQANIVIGHFSILNRSNSRLFIAGTVDSSAFVPTVTEFESADITTEADNNNLKGRAVYASIGNALIKQLGIIESSDLAGGKAHFVIPQGDPLTAAFANGARFVVV